MDKATIKPFCCEISHQIFLGDVNQTDQCAQKVSFPRSGHIYCIRLYGILEVIFSILYIRKEFFQLCIIISLLILWWFKSSWTQFIDCIDILVQLWGKENYNSSSDHLTYTWNYLIMETLTNWKYTLLSHYTADFTCLLSNNYTIISCVTLIAHTDLCTHDLLKFILL